MAIVFTKKKRKQNVLVFIFLFIIIIIILILWQGFFGKTIQVFHSETKLIPPKEVKIDFQVFNQAKKFKPFIEITFFDENQIGRDNPFLNY